MRFLCNSFTNKVAGLQSIDKFTENNVFDKDIFQQLFIGLQASWRRLEDVVNVPISVFSRHFEDMINVLENEKFLGLRKIFLLLE